MRKMGAWALRHQLDGERVGKGTRKGDKDNADLKGPQSGDGMLEKVAAWRVLRLGLGDMSVYAGPCEA